MFFWGDFGFYLLLLCFLLSCYGSASAFLAAHWRHLRLYRSARMANACVMGLVGIAALIMLGLLYSRDYGIAYIYRNSSDDLPWMYTLSAFWAALEGSHFLWTLFLTFYTFIAHWTYAKDNEHIMPYVSGSLQGVLAWMYYLAVTHSNPFGLQFPIPEQGLGMNALLQNPYMAIHPPSLFSGYTAMAIPCAYSFAALCYGDITEGWLRTTRRWALYGFMFLTAGVFLGGRWAYVELGWAGYWAWDPVENSSFMPWLFTTALLHSLLLQEKLGHLKRLSLILSFLAFFFSYFGTFITRSGVISSVHSFAQSPIGPNYLYFLAGLIVISVLLYGLRADGILPGASQKTWGRETLLMIGLFLFLTFALIVFMGTINPIISETITGVRFNVQAPYFSSFAPYLGFLFVTTIALGNLMRYKSGHVLGGFLFQGQAFFLSCFLSGIFCYFADIFYSQGFALWMQIIGVFLGMWCLTCLFYDFKMRKKSFSFSFFLSHNLAYMGALISHVGVVMAVFGFLGNFRGASKTVTFNQGEKVQFFGYEFEFETMTLDIQDNATLYVAPLKVTKDGQNLGTVRTARAKYPTKPELLHEVDFLSSFRRDIYVVLSDFDSEKGERATVEIYINPTVRLVWWSGILIVFGGFLSILDRFRGQRSRDVLAGNYDLKEAGGSLK